jgi:hypothetical protein
MLDSSGRVAAFLPESRVGNAAPGTPMTVNVGGTPQVLTVGQVRQTEGAQAGAGRVVGTDAGRPIMERTGPATGDLAPAGIPVVVGTDAGRPIIVNMTEEQAAAFRRTRRVPAPAAAPMPAR